jgi:plastocyanin
LSHDEHGHEREPIILTSGKRFGKGLAILVITLAVGAAILVPFFNDFYKNPPPVTQIRTTKPPTTQPPGEARTTTIAILQGASAQGNPDFSSDEKPEVPLGNKVVWDNQDTVLHTATSGTDPKDPNMGKLFDTSYINGGEKSKAIELTGVKEGDTINYFCTVHPFMTSKITITGAEKGGQTGGETGGSTAAATINILEGASIEGSKAYDPATLTAKKGDEVSVINQDTLPHTVTSGTGNNDPNKGKLFDTNIINGGASAKISLAELDPGEYNYFCFIHEYMKGKIVVE